MGYELIIAEKPNASAKIASALGDAVQKKAGKVSYYEVKHNSKKIIVVPAVGHLFTLSEKEKSFKYPVFDIEWKPTYEVNKTAAFSKPYFNLIKKITKEASEYIVATDYDAEGEVIGLNILRFICKQKDAKRMKFSTLTKEDLKESYKNISSTLNWGQAEAGLTRHYLDFYYGINLSKAATDALYLVTHRFNPLSIGRVQGPTLEILSERELLIQAFKPEPYWQIFINLDINNKKFQAIHEKEKFFEEKESNKIFEKIKDKNAKILEVKKTKQKVSVPVPFDLTTLQIESYRCLKISPKSTLQLAQALYEASLISYPRTSSQKIPKSINIKKIVSNLALNPAYKESASKILKTKLKPNEGKKKDPAHPSIYPTGEVPKKIEADQRKLYDLIVKRFLSVFSIPGLRETTKAIFDIEKEKFILKGTRTLEKGWQEIYEPYSAKEETELPVLEINQIFNQKSQIDQKETLPPKRYTQASIIKELEKHNLGTKATRSQILDTLYQRGYIRDTSIQVTKLGLEIVKTFKKYIPKILSEDLTALFEKDMEKIREGKLKKEKVLDSAKKVLIKNLEKFAENKSQIGKELAQAVYETRKQESFLKKCHACKEGNIRIIISKKSGKRFLACDNYPKCKTTWPLPQKGKLSILRKKLCKHCKTPLIAIYTFKRRPWQFCPNPNCPSKKEDYNKKEDTNNKEQKQDQKAGT